MRKNPIKPQPGDVVRVRSNLGSELVCLFDVSRPHFVQGILVHTTPEMATDMDVILARRSTEAIEIPAYLKERFPEWSIRTAERMLNEPYLTGTVTPYPLVLCCDLYGQFLRTQVDKVVAHLDFPVGHPLLQPAKIAEALGGYRGMPLQGPVDPRWQEKVRLLEEELRPLTYPFWSSFKW
jgi:hypothetical protein